MPIRDTLETLRETGLGSITGGGAEIFDPTVRDQICRGKETAAEWLDVHRTWHSMGGRSTCTMLYGHIETLAHRADHLRQLRQLQDETAVSLGLFLLRSSRPNPTVFWPT
jgi:aminodeoxyfutalosine synthase